RPPLSTHFPYTTLFRSPPAGIPPGVRTSMGMQGPGRQWRDGLLRRTSAAATRRKREASVLGEYLPILLFLFVATVIAIALLAIGWALGPKNATPEKLSPYECGFEAFEDARRKFDVRY